MGIKGFIRNIFDGTIQEVDSIDNAVLRGESGLGDVVVEELKCVR